MLSDEEKRLAELALEQFDCSECPYDGHCDDDEEKCIELSKKIGGAPTEGECGRCGEEGVLQRVGEWELCADCVKNFNRWVVLA